MAKAQAKCYCTAPLLPDGTCRYNCDPALRSPARRAIRAQAAIPRERNGYDLVSHREAVEGAARAGVTPGRWTAVRMFRRRPAR